MNVSKGQNGLSKVFESVEVKVRKVDFLHVFHILLIFPFENDQTVGNLTLLNLLKFIVQLGTMWKT